MYEAKPRNENMIHKTANIWGQVMMGSGVKVGAFCDIGGSIDHPTFIGDDCKIQAFVSIPPDTSIGNRVFVGPGARFANDKHPDLSKKDWEPEGAHVEDDVVIGMGALIGPGVKIGKGAIIGMGAVVIHDVPAGETWVGNPAKKL